MVDGGTVRAGDSAPLSEGQANGNHQRYRGLVDVRFAYPARNETPASPALAEAGGVSGVRVGDVTPVRLV